MNRLRLHRSRAIIALLLSLAIFLPACGGRVADSGGGFDVLGVRETTSKSVHEATRETTKSAEETTAENPNTEKTDHKASAPKTQKPVEAGKKVRAKLPKVRDFYSKGDPKTPKNLVSSNSTAGAIPAVEPFNFGRDPGGPTDKTLYLSIPKIGLADVPVYNSTSEEDLNRSTVHVPATGFPWQKGANTFIAGHRLGYANTGSYRVFFALDQVTEGDEIIIKDSSGRQFVYKVFKQTVVKPTNVDIMSPVDGEAIVSLQTCTLPDYSERLIVQGKLVDKSG